MSGGHSIQPMAISLGLNLPYVEGSMDGATPRWADILAMAKAGEAVGFDTLWISDHLGFGDPAGEWSGAWESMTLFSALAVAVPRVRLGTYVTAMPLRNPALLAKMAETLDEVSGGRFILGLGAGWNEPEFTAFGVPFERRFDALGGGPADHRGDVPRRARGPRRGMVAGAPRPRRHRADHGHLDHRS